MRYKNGLRDDFDEPVSLAPPEKSGDRVSSIGAHHDKRIFPFEHVIQQASIRIAFECFKADSGIAVLKPLAYILFVFFLPCALFIDLQ